MSIRTFIFCDACNPLAIRNIFEGEHGERRITGEPSWYEGFVPDAVELGWKVDKQNNILCPHCVEKNMASLLLQIQQGSNKSNLNV